MTAPMHSDPFEPERYELGEAPTWRFELDRRRFLELFGGGIAIALVLPRLPAAAGLPQSPAETIAAFLHVDEDGGITVYTGKVEIGQGTRTALTQAVAEELRVAPDQVTLVMGDTDRVPYDRGTFGSQSTPRMMPQLRRAAAAARGLLVARAAERFGVGGGRTHRRRRHGREAAGGHSVTFAELAKGVALTETIDASVPLTPAEHWTVLGKSTQRVGARDLVTGAHRFPSDTVRPGMLHGKVLRPPAFGAKLTAIDVAAMKDQAGVTVVRDGDFAGVVARPPTPRPTRSAC